MVETVPENEGVMLSINPEGKMVITRWRLPLESRASLWGWTMDFLRVLEDFSKFRLLLLRLVLGRYGYSELVGILEDIKARGEWIPGVGYGLQGMNYHKENVKLNFELDK